MPKIRLVSAALLVLLLTSSGLTQNYNLDWENLQTTVREKDHYTLDWSDTETVVSLNVQPESIERPDPAPLPSLPKPQTKNPVSDLLNAPRAHLNLVASQWYDYDQQRYRLVDRVEVTMYPREGGIEYRTFENLGDLRHYDVFLKHLSPGDRYEALIVWDDGSNRTVGDSLRGQGWRSVFVDMPDALGYKVWPSNRF